MIGYTRKVGLRKSPLHFAALRARRVVRQAAAGAKGDDWQWLTDALEQIRRESGDFDPRAEYEANWESAWLEERERRRAALEAAKRRVASIPADHRRYLEGEFLRAEHKAAAIVAHGRTPCPHCPCTYSTECCYCDGSRTPLEDS